LAGLASIRAVSNYRSHPHRKVTVRNDLVAAAQVAGILGLIGWAVGIANRGGFRDAFAHAKGGVTSDSGYIRDAPFLLLILAILLLQWAWADTPYKLKHYLALGLLSIPWLIQAFLGARRGPLFVIVFIFVCESLRRTRRKGKLFIVFGAVAMTGYLMIFLVNNRDKIYLGSEWNLQYRLDSLRDDAAAGNEYIYGTGAVLHARAIDKYYWGRRYLVEAFVRPVPRSIWPAKYKDAGVPELEDGSAGARGKDFRRTLGWAGGYGAYPGLVGDVWLEFSWLALPVLYGIGRLYSAAWARARAFEGVWFAQYTLLSAISVYVVMQGPVEAIFRLLFLSSLLWVAQLFARQYRVARQPIRPSRMVTS
jgi:hypothetical protein